MITRLCYHRLARPPHPEPERRIPATIFSRGIGYVLLRKRDLSRVIRTMHFSFGSSWSRTFANHPPTSVINEATFECLNEFDAPAHTIDRPSRKPCEFPRSVKSHVPLWHIRTQATRLQSSCRVKDDVSKQAVPASADCA
jgi:hypothetical protein